MAAMRRWLLLALVLLLPLRGLVGEAMAGEMMARAVQAAHAPQQVHAASPDCDHHGGGHHGSGHHAPTDASAAQTQAQPADCPTCAACQVCSSVAVVPTLHTPASERLSQAPPEAVALAWRSAEPALSFKPPRG